jgi:hypothetical protein
MPILNDHYSYKIAEHFLSAIINNDFAGLTADEESQVYRFLSEANNLPDATWTVPDDQDPNYAICEICDLYADCYEVRLYFTNQTLEA